MINAAIRDKSKCAICSNKKSRFMKLNHNKRGQYYYKTNRLTYCLKCKRNTKNIDAKMLEIKNGKLMLSSK